MKWKCALVWKYNIDLQNHVNWEKNIISINRQKKKDTRPLLIVRIFKWTGFQLIIITLIGCFDSIWVEQSECFWGEWSNWELTAWLKEQIRRQGQREEWKERSVRDRASEGHYLTGELVLLAKPPLPSVTPLRSVQQWNKKVAVKHQGNKMDRMGGKDRMW